MNAMRDALDRTLLLMRDELHSDVADDVLLAALTGMEIAVVADAETLHAPAAQTAFVTTALLCARSGHKVHLLAPDVPLAQPQLPLRGAAMIAALLAADGAVMPARRFESQLPDHAIDLEIRLGASPRRCEAHATCAIGATRWSGHLTRNATVPWMRDLVWPMGAMAAATLGSIEAFKCAMHKLAPFARSPELFAEFFAALADATLTLAPEATPMASALGAFDIISGGAMTNGLLYGLARLPSVTGVARVVEPDIAEASNLNRYALLTIEDLGKPKAERLAALDLGGLTLKPLPWRFKSPGSIGVLAPRVLVGVDHIPTRWAVQRAMPRYLGIGATTHWSAMASCHRPGEACAGCAHPRDDMMEGPIPTVAFVSFLAALLQATDFLREVACARAVETLAYVTALRPDRIWRTPITEHPACPVRRASSAGQSA
jgi:hypothetical protein